MNTKIIELKNVKNIQVDNFFTKIGIQEFFYKYFIINELIANIDISKLKSKNEYSKKYNDIVSYFYKNIESIDKIYPKLKLDENNNKNGFKNLKINYLDLYTFDIIPYYSFLLNNDDKINVLEITDNFHNKSRIGIYKVNTNKKFRIIMNDSKSFKEEDKISQENLYKKENYLLLGYKENDKSIKERYKYLKNEWNTYDYVYASTDSWLNMAYPYVYYNLNLVLYLKNCITALRFLKKGGTLHLILNLGLPSKATLDFFDIIGTKFKKYKIHINNYELLQNYVPIDLLDFEGISEKDLNDLYNLYEKYIENQYDIMDLVNYAPNQKLSKDSILTGFKIKKFTTKNGKDESIKILSQLKDDNKHSGISKDINNYMEFVTNRRINNLKYMFYITEQIKDRKEDDNFTENILQIFIKNQIQNIIATYKEYNIPYNDFIQKINSYFTEQILKEMYNVNDYTKYLIPTESYNFPNTFPNGVRQFDYPELYNLYMKNNMVRFHRSEYETAGYEKEVKKAKIRISLLRDNLKPILKNKLNLNLTPNNAFIKLYEILKLNPFLIPKKNKINTFHLAEAPGHFIKCVESYIKRRDVKQGTKTNFEWWANSLNPFNSKVRKNFDSFIGDDYKLIRNNPGKWLWGKDNTGDITKPENLRNIKQFIIKNNVKLDLVTGDAGLAVRESDLELLQKIDLAQALGSAYLTDINKHVVLKHFTPFIINLQESRDSTGFFVSLIYFYACCFNKVQIIKPTSSSPLGGEFYLIGFQKKASADKLIDKYLNKLDTFKVNQPLFFKKDIPDEFYYNVFKFLELIVGLNIKTITYQNYITNCIINEKEKDRLKECEILSEGSFVKISKNRVNEWLKMYL